MVLTAKLHVSFMEVCGVLMTTYIFKFIIVHKSAEVKNYNKVFLRYLLEELISLPGSLSYSAKIPKLDYLKHVLILAMQSNQL